MPNFLQKLFFPQKVVTRIAPSPTGLFHIGTARSALFNYLFARHHNGRFIVRIEDTDTERSTKESEADILSGLSKLGLSYDALFRQSERTEIYTRYLTRIVDSGAAYISKEESTAKPGTFVEVVRLKNPGKTVPFTDHIRGEITFDTAELGDFVIARSMTEPLYHLAVVVDDYEMGITHVIRGEDHVSNTPRQILIQEALDLPRPEYAHIPLILAPDRSKMSKRKGSTSISEFLQKGYLPGALLNYLAFLGWNPGTDKELFTLHELIHEFSLEQVQKGGAVFDIQKLNWFNREYLKEIPHTELVQKVLSYLDERVKGLTNFRADMIEKIAPIIIERIDTLSDITKLSQEGEYDYYFSDPILQTRVSWKDCSAQDTATHLERIIEMVETVPEDSFTAPAVKDAIWEYATEQGRGAVLWPMRVALSGREKSPDPFWLASIFGKEEVLVRLRKAHATLV